ncbi:hypothetical protein ABZS96_45460, partial [Streptomyces avermitilis]|uniref:hypothetical protein n=1 Tax=Streptomyces avermitilis TaxID=33903 RepID=UPI0033A6EC0A
MAAHQVEGLSGQSRGRDRVMEPFSQEQSDRGEVKAPQAVPIGFVDRGTVDSAAQFRAGLTVGAGMIVCAAVVLSCGRGGDT